MWGMILRSTRGEVGEEIAGTGVKSIKDTLIISPLLRSSVEQVLEISYLGRGILEYCP
jgi:hypothetical protein